MRGDGGQRIDGREGWLRDEVWKLVHDPEITSEEQLLERAVEAFDRECAWGATALSATAYSVEDVARKVRAAWAKRERGEVKPNARTVPDVEPFYKISALPPAEATAKLRAIVTAVVGAEPPDTAVRVTAGGGKTTLIAELIDELLPPGKVVFFIVPGHKLAKEVEAKFEHRKVKIIYGRSPEQLPEPVRDRQGAPGARAPGPGVRLRPELEGGGDEDEPAAYGAPEGLRQMPGLRLVREPRLRERSSGGRRPTSTSSPTTTCTCRSGRSCPTPT